MHSNAEWPEGGIGDAWEKKLEAACNVEIEWLLPPTSAYEENLQLMMMDEDKPDAVIIPESWLTQASFKTACQDGIFTDLKPLLETGAYENIMAHTRNESWNALDCNQTGNIWGIPRSTMIRIEGWAMIKDYWEALGGDEFYKEGTTISTDEFLDILIAMTKEDPDGNGIDDTYGYKTSASGGKLDGGGNVIFHCGAGWILDEATGEYFNPTYSKTCTWYKDNLLYTKAQYEAGVFDPDVFTIDGTMATEREALKMYGVAGCFPGWLKVDDDLESRKAGNPNAYSQIYIPEVVSEDGDFWCSNFSTGIWWFWAVPADCERPDKVLEVFDYLLGDEAWMDAVCAGVRDVSYTYDEATGEYDFTLEDEAKAANSEWGTGNPIKSIVRRATGSDFFVSRKYSPETRAKLEGFIDIAVENGTVSLDRGYKPAIGSDSVYIEYNATLGETANKIITGELGIEAWDEWLDGWYAAGGEEYTKDMQAYIAAEEAKGSLSDSIIRN